MPADPLWYLDAIVYELRVSAFQDSDGDGIGDFRGLVERLDYLQDLGVTALWLLPFYPSPLRDDGYDIADYESVHPDCGSLEDFQAFLGGAHRRGLRVITELVLNHTSDQHPWFQRARRAPPGSTERDFYVWSESPERYAGARVIFKDFEPSNWTWDPVARAYYWHRFYAHQPDLNFAQPAVREAMLRVLDFWLELGVDGLRLDAVPYLFEHEGTPCENLPETHAFLRDVRRHVDARFADRMLLAEANQWPEDAAAYFGAGDECHMAFHFPLMPRLFMALHMEDRFPVVDILQQTPAIAEGCQWALFLRNHDELTLEMVTDEERDYMYRVYAHDARARLNLGIRRRLAPLLGNDRRRIELMNALLLSLPGTPFLYYGDEIGMGDNIHLGDRNGVRTPMQWSGDRNAGFSRANPQRLQLPVIIDPEYHYESVNVEVQQNSPHSILAWTKRLISLRKRHLAFGRGSIDFLSPGNRKVLAFVRRHGDERILVVANLSRFVEYVELDLRGFAGMVPVELFARRAFPAIGELPYLLTLGPHSFYWFELAATLPRGDLTRVRPEARPPRLRARGSWRHTLDAASRAPLEAGMPPLLTGRRWFRDAGSVRSAAIRGSVAIGEGEAGSALVLLRVEREGGGETYALPLRFAEGERAAQLRRELPHAVFAELEVEKKEGTTQGVLFDALEDAGFCLALVGAVARQRRLRGEGGELVGWTPRPLRAPDPANAAAGVCLLPERQRNSSVRIGDAFVLKLFRRLEEGVNPEVELGLLLAERGFAHAAPLAGALEWRAPRREPITVATLHGFVANEGDAWHYALDRVNHYFEDVLAQAPAPGDALGADGSLLGLTHADPPPLVLELMGGDLEWARLLGRRLAELHRALASAPEVPALAPEPFGSLYQRSLYQSLRGGVRRVFERLGEAAAALPEPAHGEALGLLGREGEVLETCRAVVGPALGGMRIRCHGDLHLGQVLFTGNDFVFFDLEGDPGRSLGERRGKRSPLRDVTGLLRSFDRAAHGPLLGRPTDAGAVREEDVPRLEPWARFWRQWASSAFLRSYLHAVADSGLLPPAAEALERLLHALLLEQCVDEIARELDAGTPWVRLPLRAAQEILGPARAAED